MDAPIPSWINEKTVRPPADPASPPSRDGAPNACQRTQIPRRQAEQLIPLRDGSSQNPMSFGPLWAAPCQPAKDLTNKAIRKPKATRKPSARRSARRVISARPIPRASKALSPDQLQPEPAPSHPRRKNRKLWPRRSVPDVSGVSRLATRPKESIGCPLDPVKEGSLGGNGSLKSGSFLHKTNFVCVSQNFLRDS